MKRTLAFIVLCLPLEARGPRCPIALQQTPECSSCTLDEWARKVSSLKERPVEFSSLPDKMKYQENILTFTEYMTTLNKTAAVIARECSIDNQWLNKKSLYSLVPNIFTLNRPSIVPAVDVQNFPFKPYARRLTLERDSQVCFFGDLHGSAHSLLRDLKKLKELGYLDNQFKITKKNFHIIFLGDYIDRGIYGVEVVYTLCRLKLANPSQVILVRGNHEDYILAPDFRKKHTKEEQKDNAPSFHR